MAAVDTSRYNELCRLCATKTTDLLGVHIFQNDDSIGQLRKKIETCLPIQVHETDELPKIICEICLYKLNMLCDFREKSVRTERLLLDLIKEINESKQSQQVMSVVPMDHNDLIIHHHQQLLSNQVMTTVGEIDLSQLGSREQMIVGHEIILTHQTVDMNEYDLANQEISTQNLQTHNPVLVETGNARYADNLDIIHHQQLINDQFRLQHELHVNMTQANGANEINMNEGLNNSVTHKINNNLEHNSNYHHGHRSEGTLEKKQNLEYQENSSTNNNLPINTHLNDLTNHSLTIKDDVKIESPKIEDSNSNSSLHIDETNRQVYTVQSNDNTTSIERQGWLYCNICGSQYKDEASFDKHYETHFEKCTICFAVFTNSEVLNTHRKEAHGNTEETPIKTRLKRATVPVKGENTSVADSNSDDSGGDFLEDENDDSQHVEISGKGGATKRKIWSPKVCTECGKSYKTNYKLAEHMRKHTGEKPYKCKDCDKEFRSKIGLAQHEAKHTGKYDYACPTCGKGFQCKSYLMVHQRVHSDVKPYPCTTCGRHFKTKQSLLDHTNRHLGVKPFMCETCGRGFITKGLCKAHQKVHNGLDNRKYSCKVCNKKFVSKSYLQTHLRIHTGEKPFICEVCGKGFLTKVDLRIHTTMHTGEKSYVCEMCGKAFARRDALRCHRRSHTGERPYSCEICGQTFTQFTPMAIHKRLHTGERPYACDFCGKTFVSRSTMMAHAKKHTR